ncbi:MAG: TRAP transporter small permease [Betaproteobacteria bacterium]|nr:TRAP transporter small permease [Betaproteobacteria bacterium]
MIERIAKGAALVGGVVTLLITVLISFDVLMRYFVDAPQLFVDELASYLQILIIFGGLAYTFVSGGHVRVDLLTNSLTPVRRARLRALTLLVGCGLVLIVTWVTLQTTITAFDYGRLSAVMLYPLWLPMAFIPLGLALFAIAMLIALARQLRRLNGPKSELGEVRLELSGEKAPKSL